jgi:guanylate kinase
MARQTQKSRKQLVIVLSGPSAGAGKNTIVQQLLKKRSQLEFVPGTTTRPKQRRRGGDRAMRFVTLAQFRALKKQGVIIESARVTGHWYGTNGRLVERILARGKVPLIMPDVHGHTSIRRLAPKFGFKVCSMFVAPGNFSELRTRIMLRQPDVGPIWVRKRLALAKRELTHKHEYDAIIINRQNQLDRAVADALRYVDRCLTQG